MYTCHSVKSYFSRLQKRMSFHRKKSSKPRPIISAPFDFKKEDTLCFLQGISSEELSLMREKAAASIVGSASSSPFPDSPLLGSASHMRPQTAASATTTGSQPLGRAFHPNHYHRLGGPMAFHPVILASTEPYTPAGLCPPSSSASSASSIKSVGRDRD